MFHSTSKRNGARVSKEREALEFKGADCENTSLPYMRCPKEKRKKKKNPKTNFKGVFV